MATVSGVTWAAASTADVTRRDETIGRRTGWMAGVITAILVNSAGGRGSIVRMTECMRTMTGNGLLTLAGGRKLPSAMSGI